MSSSFDIKILPDPNTYWTFSIDWGASSANVVLAGGSIVPCDELFVTPASGTFNGPPTSLRITSSQVPAFTITSVTVSPLLVSLGITNGTATIRWYGSGTLQLSPDLQTWSDLPSASSPYIIPMTGTNQFFRIRVPGP